MLTDRGVVRHALAELELRPSKRLGQSFLVDRAVVDAVAEAVEVFEPTCVIEIGPGLGALTEHVAPGVGEYVAIEVDGRLVERLRSILADLSHVTVLHQDVLTYDFEISSDRTLVVGSIPYAITAPILQRLIAHRDGLVGAVLLTQREVAEKVEVSPGASGTALGTLVRAYADIERLRLVRRGCFFPAPDVDSSLWAMRFLGSPRFSADETIFFGVVRAIYGARRKMIRSALRSLAEKDDVARALQEAGIEPTIRGETLDFDALDRLAQAFDGLGVRPQQGE